MMKRLDKKVDTKKDDSDSKEEQKAPALKYKKVSRELRRELV